MRKNVASQVVGAQMITAADGSAFTGSVTVAVTGNGGTQATGSVGSGACTHKGGGYHTYAPAQAETNYDYVAFTFSGTGAIPVTVQIYTDFPQTGDSFARLGAPAGASVSADIATIDSEVGVIDGNVDLILEDTGTTLPGLLAVIDGIVDAIVADTGTDGVVVNAAGLATDAVNEIRDAILAAVVESEGSITFVQMMRIILAVLAGETTISGGTYTILTPNGNATRVTVTLDVNKQRTAVTLNP